MAVRKGQTVTYRAQGGEGGKVQAKVLRVHRDGSATVEATFALFDDGQLCPGYLGMKFRLQARRMEVVS